MHGRFCTPLGGYFHWPWSALHRKNSEGPLPPVRRSSWPHSTWPETSRCRSQLCCQRQFPPHCSTPVLSAERLAFLGTCSFSACSSNLRENPRFWSWGAGSCTPWRFFWGTSCFCSFLLPPKTLPCWSTSQKTGSLALNGESAFGRFVSGTAFSPGVSSWSRSGFVGTPSRGLFLCIPSLDSAPTPRDPGPD